MTEATFVERVPWTGPSRFLLVAVALVCVGGAVAAVLGTPPRERPLALLFSVPGIAVVVAVAIVFKELRIALDGETLTTGFGPFRRRVPLRTIARCEPLTYRWLDYGGWGIRWRPGSTLYNVPGDQGQAVQLTLVNNKRFLFSSRESQEWCQRLRASNPGILAP
jgi:hypothetical protein